MQRLIPFPPYTADALCTRFPQQAETQLKLALLRSHLLDGHTRQSAARSYGISQARLSQIVTRWEDAGVAGVVASRRTRARPRWSDASLRTLLRGAGRLSLLQLGALAEARDLLPALSDPLERGVWLDTTIRRALYEQDQVFQQTYAITGLLADYCLRGLAVKYLAQRESISVSRAYELIRQGSAAVLEQVTRLLPARAAPFPWRAHLPAAPLLGREKLRTQLYQALHHSRIASLTGLPGIGKSALAASCADDWHRYGWNVIWLSRSQAERPLDEPWAELHRQLAGLGVLPTHAPDPSRPWQDQLATIVAGLRKMPILLVIDDCHELLQRHKDGEVLQRLGAAELPLRVLLCGLHTAQAAAPEIRLDGIDEEAAYALFCRSAPQNAGSLAERARWRPIYASTHGNPKLIQLRATAPDDVVQSYGRGLIEAILRRLPLECLKLAAWLSWWDEPIGQESTWQLPATRHGLQMLQHYHIIALQHGRAIIHDLVREQLPVVLGGECWRTIQAEVEQAAVAAQRWSLAFRCAQGQRDLATQMCYAREAAEAAERHEQPLQARQWWETYARLAEQVADREARCQGLLRAAWMAIQLYQPGDAAQILASAQPYDPVTRWQHALYRAYCLRFQGDFETAWSLQHAPPLNQPVPEEIQPSLRRLLMLERIITDHLKGQKANEWQRFLALEPPSAASDPVFYSQYHRIGAQIALNAYDFPTYLRLNRRFLAWSLRKGYRYAVLESRLEWARALYESEKYQQAHRQFQQICDAWEPHWHVLHIRYLVYCSMLSCEKGELDHACAMIAACEQMAGEHKLLQLQALVPLLRAQVLLGAQALDAAAEELEIAAQRYRDLADAGQLAVVKLWQAQLLLQQHDPAAARETLRNTIQIIWQHRWPGLHMHVRPLWGRIMLALGDLGRAERHLRHAAQDPRQHDVSYSVAERTGYLVEVLLHQQRYAEAFALSQPLLPLLERQPVGVLRLPRLAAVCARSYAAAARPELATRAWQAALRHLRFQSRHLPPNADLARFLAHPLHAQILAAADTASAAR
jgi:transposase